MKPMLVAFATVAAVLPSPLRTLAQTAAPAPAAEVKYAATFERQAVAADHPVASAAGAEILAAGGNAVDAAVAASFTLSVVRPFSCGIGGGGFMVIAIPPLHGKPAINTAINYRETCPAGVGPEYYEKLGEDGKDAPKHGGKAVATPGTIAGLLYALEKYGTLDRARVLAPAIRVAREGFAADAAYVSAANETIAKFEKHPEWKTRFAFTWERFLGSGTVHEGDQIKVPEQAAALELIVHDGLKAFREGEIGRTICAAAKADGGTLAPEDLKTYRPAEVEPIRFEALGRTFLTMPPPSSGGVALAQTLGILERRDAAGMVKREEWAPYAHTLIEGFKHAFADRAEWMADPAFVEVPVKRLLSKEYLDARAAKIQRAQTQGPESYGTRAAPPDDGGTSHLCVVDAHGGAVSCTETINLLFGSLLAVPQFGFILNDQMDDFTTRRGEPNAFKLTQSDKNLPAPGKRPLSSMTPTIVLDARGDVEAVAGASGGPRIITGTTQVLLNALLLGLPAGEAVSRPRMHHQWMPNLLEIEEGYPGRWEGIEVRLWMQKLHHQVIPAKEHCVVQLIKRTVVDGVTRWEAASDPRKGGRPAGK
jgi:gamma-glutamyltranspeptidase / glutathione hydrolase